MIESVRTFCIYCRGELIDDQEITLYYHIACQNEFEIKTSDFEYFDPHLVDTFSDEIAKSRKISPLQTLLLIVLMIGSLYLATIYIILSIFFLFLVMALLFRSAYTWGKVDNTLYFCNILKEINPECMYLTKSNCIASIGDIYIVNKSKMLNSFKGMYFIKFLDSETDKLNKNEYIESVYEIAQKNNLDSIHFSSSIKNYQIQFNSRDVKKGLATIYSIQYKDLRFKESHLNQLLGSLNHT